MKLHFKVTFKSGTKTVAEIEGQEEVLAQAMPLEDLHKLVITTEQSLENLTGFRVHISLVR